MQPRFPRRPDTHQAGGPPDDDARLGAELAAVIAAARRRAIRDADRQVDTAHLLHSLLEHDPEVRSVFDDGPRIARLLGYLVQRSIGYGLLWQGSVEDSGSVPVVREADGFSPLAAGALEYACARAASRGDEPARGVDLLAAICVDKDARAVEVLDRAGVDARELYARIESRPENYAHDCGC
ncbi:Clp amino terminal domain-containing protein, pathogenicity island component [Streptomyces sp. DI166]|uniref:Clp protease N-terminal domain-containing protein n=1 Tax=unclassified Streptomyces TaxID=2593676 RepID=UPI0007F5307E|nr:MULTISPECIES: Clp protease N-terminal domain-containing protein [unclassified Streptomyces]SBT95425.1 Clp amino terminal domain-containing protein, pathogenicity island component [Streptomyces sp. DI166]